MLRSPRWATIWSVLRLAMAAAIVAAIVAQLVATVETTIELERDMTTTIANFFSFFTILSNVAAAIVLVWAALWFFAGRHRATDREPRVLALALASATTYMIVTGIVYNVLLRSITLPQGSEPVWWSNEVLHLVAPLFLLADVFAGPVRRALSWRAVWAIIVFPLVWTAYTLLRGPLVTNPVSGDPYWYPYPFLNPNGFDNGYVGVSLYIVGIAVGIIAVALFTVWIGRRRAVRQPAASTS